MANPTRIEHFEIVRELGRGGMGKVYLARDTQLERSVAIKVVTFDGPPAEHDRQEREAFSQRLLREAKIAATLEHPGIVVIYQGGVVDDQPFIVMQYVDGATLDALLEAGRPFDHVSVRRVLNEVAAALDYAHDMGVIHRDIKPANIILTRTGAAKICDFGIAKSAVLSTKPSSVLMGTPHYMAPEQLSYEPVDRRTDQWALAVMAYRLLAGQLPFQGEDLRSLAAGIVGVPPPSPLDFNPTLPVGVIPVLQKALSKNPTGRYATCSEFATNLLSALDGVETVLMAPAATTRPLPAAPPWTRKWFLAGAAAIVVSATLAAEIYAHRHGAKPSQEAIAKIDDIAAAKAYFEANQFDKALPILQKGAAGGNPEAEARLGIMYENGLGGLPKDDVQAVNWLRKAAAGGNALAMNNLGNLHENGRGGLPQDDIQAANWYRKSAEAGYGRAMTNLGLMYDEGRGALPLDDAQALVWFRKAADAGDPYGMANLGGMYHGAHGGLAKDDVQAVYWYRKAAEGGDTFGMTSLGFMYHHGWGGLPQNDVEAVNWYRKAAEGRDSTAMNNLGDMYRDGKGGLPQDDAQAVKWYRNAAEAGEDTAMYNLGGMYELGRGGLPKDPTQAATWYRTAAGLGNPQAQKALKRLGR